MALTNEDLLALKAELTNDPQTLGLTTLPADDEANANKLNQVRETISVKRRSVAASELFNAIDPIEHQALSAQQERWVNAVIELGQIDPFRDTQILDGLAELFGEGTNSGPALAAVYLRNGSRVEQLFQAGTLSTFQQLSGSDIANARNAS